MAGVAGWALETEYGGGGRGGAMETLLDGTVRIFEVDEQRVDEEGHPVETLVFEGSKADAKAWIELHGGDRNYLIPGFFIAAGGLLAIASVLPRIGGIEAPTEREAP